MRDPVRSCVLVLLSAGCLAFATAQPCRAGWEDHPLTRRSVSFSYESTADTAVAANGDSVAAWIDEPSGVAWSAVERGGTWSPPAPIFALAPNAPEQVIAVDVALGGDGTAHAALLVHHFERGLAYQVVVASRRAPGDATWSAPVEVSARGPVGTVALGADGAGAALVVWTSGAAVLFADGDVSGHWSAPATVPGCSGLDDFALHASGAAAITWIEGPSGARVVRIVQRAPGGAWSAAADVAKPVGAPYSARVGLDGAGASAVAWIEASGGAYALAWTRPAAGGSWAAPDFANAPTANVLAADLAADDAGGVALAWSEVDLVTGDHAVRSALVAADGSAVRGDWTGMDLSFGAEVRVARAADASIAVVTWIDGWLATSWAAVHTPATGWNAGTQLGAGLLGTAVVVDCDDATHASVAWAEPTGVEFWIAYTTATFDLVLPRPDLSAVTPAKLRRNAGPATLTLRGDHFQAGPGTTVLRFDGAQRTTTVLTPRDAAAQLLAVDLAVEGLHDVEVFTAAPGGGTSRTLPVLVDGTPPTTAVLLSGRLGDAGWFTRGVTVRATSTDTGAGVARVTCALDGGPDIVRTFVTPDSPATPTVPRRVGAAVRGDGIHVFDVVAEDAVGNVETPQVAVVRIDMRPPALRLSVAPKALRAAPGATADVALTGTVADTVSGLRPGGVAYDVRDEYGLDEPAGVVSVAADGSYALVVPLATERRPGDADGRRYRISVTATDVAGLSRIRTTTVIVR